MSHQYSIETEGEQFPFVAPVFFTNQFNKLIIDFDLCNQCFQGTVKIE